MTNNNQKNITIGFIGQGWIGRNMADHYEEAGYPVIRYANVPEYALNLPKLANADVIFVAVPTPTTEKGFDDSIIRGVIAHALPGQTVVIKSTILPGTTDSISAQYPDVYVLHAPEFLREVSVREDIAHPDRNIVGIPTPYLSDPTWNAKAEEVISVLPDAPYNIVCSAPEAELTKYGSNNFLYTKVVFMNLLYDIARHHGARWDVLAKNMTADPRIGTSHMQPIHQIKHLGETAGRGAGGHCFIKDFAAFRELYEKTLGDEEESLALLRAFERKNNQLLRDSGKDLDILESVYGKLGEDIARLEEAVMKEGDDVEDLEKAYEKGDLATMEAAYREAGRDLRKLEEAYIEAGGDIRALRDLS